MVVAVRQSPVVKGRIPKLSMLELVTVANKRYKISKLRRRVLPQGFCYVCSRVDPSGVFKNPNSHLFKKGFFQTCEHFPKAPFTSFVREDEKDIKNEFAQIEQATRQPEVPSVVIKNRRDSRTSKLLTPLKRESTHGSKLTEKDSLYKFGDNVNLPSIDTKEELRLNTGQSSQKAHLLKTPSEAKTRTSRKSLAHSSRTELAEIPTPSEKIRIPTALNDDGTSPISGLSTFTGGTTPTKSANDIESNVASVKDNDTLYKNKIEIFLNPATDSSVNMPDAGSTGIQSGVYINQSDGLQGPFQTEPLVREFVMLKVSDDATARRPNAGRRRRLPSIPTETSSARSQSTYRPSSGHLRYHHRIDDDTVPHPGFSIPPTPSDDLLATADKTEQVETTDQMSVPNGSMFDSGSSKGIAESGISEDASLNLSDKISEAKSRLSRFSYENRSFCRCATAEREISFSRNVCRTCGRMCKSAFAGSGAHSRSRPLDGREANRSGSKFSVSQRLDSTLRDGARLNIRSKPYTDEDYMDLDSIIHEGERHYFSGDENERESSSTSWYHHNNSRSLSLVDPDIHKLAYLRALRAARLSSMYNSGDMEIEESKKLRRATVFSYIPLLPYRGKNAHQPDYLGLRPDNSAVPKKSQYMKHIFGNINPDDYYPDVDDVSKNKVIFDDTEEDEDTDLSGPSVEQQSSSRKEQNELERSSVSLKMSKP